MNTADESWRGQIKSPRGLICQPDWRERSEGQKTLEPAPPLLLWVYTEWHLPASLAGL